MMKQNFVESPAISELLSIVIITRNAKSLLRKCLQSIYANVSFPFEIIIIDNASNDHTVDMIMADFPEVRLIRNKRNRGVAPARNQGLCLCRGNYILILDDDTYIIGNAIDKMIAFMQEHPAVGICGPKLIGSNGELLPNSKRFPSLFSFMCNRFINQPTADSPSALQKHLMLDWDHVQAGSVDYVIGACQIIERNALDDVGFYDDTIFYGPEDIDMCYRMWQKGYQIWCVPDATIVHVTRRITKKNPFTLMSVRHLLAILRLFLKYRNKDFKKITECNDARRGNAGKRN